MASPGCPADKKITEAVLDDDLMPTYYTPEELHACLQNVSLENHFSQILTYPFNIPQLAVLKEYLDEVIPAQKCQITTDGIAQGLVNLGSPRM